MVCRQPAIIKGGMLWIPIWIPKKVVPQKSETVANASQGNKGYFEPFALIELLILVIINEAKVAKNKEMSLFDAYKYVYK